VLAFSYLEQCFMLSISFTNLTFHSVALYSTLEMSFRNTYQDGSIDIEFIDCGIDDPQRKDSKRVIIARKKLFDERSLIEPFSFAERIHSNLTIFRCWLS
jgi:hypothetical protein